LYVLNEKPKINTFDVVCTPGYEGGISVIAKTFEKHGYERDTSKPDLLAVMMGDGGIVEEGKKQVNKSNSDAIILGIKRPPKEGLYSRATLAQIKNWLEIEKYISKIDRGEYRIVEYTGVDLFIEEEYKDTAFNEVQAIRHTELGNQAIKFYLYCVRASEDYPYQTKGLKLFTRNFTEGLIVADGAVIGSKLGYGGYQKPCGVPEYTEGMGIGIILPNEEKKHWSTSLIEFLFHQQIKLKGFVAPKGSTIEFELKKGKGLIYVDHDLIANIDPKNLNKFQVRESKKRMRFIKFKSSLPLISS
jgi:NAD kinase